MFLKWKRFLENLREKNLYDAYTMQPTGFVVVRTEMSKFIEFYLGSNVLLDLIDLYGIS